MQTRQQQLADRFHALHHSGKLLILPNIWDPLGALLLESLDYPAVATASAAVAFAQGLADGEHLPFEDLRMILRKITDRVSIPVTADIETGYARYEAQLRQNIARLLDAGIVGINLEDTDLSTGALLPIEEQCHKIRLVAEEARTRGIHLFINARTDVLVSTDSPAGEQQLAEILKRGRAYKAAGADCFYPVTLSEEAVIKTVVEELAMPVNILTVPGIPPLERLQELGVARVSLGPAFLKYAIKHLRELAVKLQSQEGLAEILENEVSSQYLKDLVNKPPAANLLP